MAIVGAKSCGGGLGTRNGRRGGCDAEDLNGCEDVAPEGGVGNVAEVDAVAFFEDVADAVVEEGEEEEEEGEVVDALKLRAAEEVEDVCVGFDGGFDEVLSLDEFVAVDGRAFRWGQGGFLVA
jgi:hypothetical protein